MEPTLQTCVPWSFYAGPLPSEGTLLNWYDGADHVITCITMSADLSAGSCLAQVSDGGGRIHWRRVVSGSEALYPQSVCDNCFIVMGTTPGSTLASNALEAWISIDGYVLAPTGAGVLSVPV